MSVRAIAIAVAVAGLALAAAGCSSGAGSASGGSTSAGPSGQLTGTQLTTALLPASAFPASFAVSQQGSADSGDALEKTAAGYNLTTISCANWDNYFTGSGFGETAYTADSVANSNQDQSYGQLVYQFSSSGAASQFFTGVQSLSGRCRSFTASGGGSADRVSMQSVTASAVAGHQTFWIDRSTTVTGATSKIDTLFALDGTDVLAISASGVDSAPPAAPAPAALLQQLITSLQTHH